MRPSLIEPACPPQRRPAAASEILEFGRFRVLLCRRQLLADGTPVGLGTRAFEPKFLVCESRFNAKSGVLVAAKRPRFHSEGDA